MAKKRKNLRPMGDIMLDVEKVVLSLVYARRYSWSKLLQETATILQKNSPLAQEEYVRGGNPKLVILPKVKPAKATNKRLEILLKEMCTNHDMQWYEVLYLVYGYLQVHCPDKKDKGFKFFYGVS